ncbi:MAG: FHA domain-containing protein [Propionibacteriaceae bacterium]|jgi:hypothetical protein|nr:FHA domain-containing protein [Propionibacteriaceae bacterium]
MATRYRRGEWIALVAPRACLILPGVVAPQELERLWPAVRRGDDLAGLVQALISGPVVSLAALPDFGAVVWAPEGVQVAARGPVRITVQTAQAPVTIDGKKVATWREDTVADPLSAVIETPAVAASAGQAESLELPLEAGLVWASRVELGPAQTASSGDAPEPAPRTGGGLGQTASTGSVPEAGPDLAPDARPEAAAPAPAHPLVIPAGDHFVSGPLESSGLTTVFPSAVDWGRGDDALDPASAYQSLVPAGAPSYEELFDAPTALSVAEAAAGREEPGAAATVEPSSDSAPAGPGSLGAVWPPDDDHDGMTIASFSPPTGPIAVPAFTTAAPTGPTVLARICPRCGRPNPSRRASCLSCDAQLSQDAVMVPRPLLGRIALSNGERYPLDQPVIIGRKPRSPRFSNQDVPRLIAVNGPRQDISRSHLKIALEDWSVMVSDLGSTNGTVLRRAGQPDRRLQAAEQVVAQTGDLYDLGDGVTVSIEELA